MNFDEKYNTLVSLLESRLGRPLTEMEKTFLASNIKNNVNFQYEKYKSFLLNGE